MNRFAALLDCLAYEPRRNSKLTLLREYFAAAPDPDRGYALAAMTGGLTFKNAKPGLVRALIAERIDPTLFGLSYDYVGDLSETIALLWPASATSEAPPSLASVVETLANLPKSELPARLALWLDGLDETGRWALLKLITGGLRIGVSTRLAKTAIATLGAKPVGAIEEIWHGLHPPYAPLFAWLEGRGPAPAADDPAPFRPPMLAHPLEEADIESLDASQYCAEWKWDGIRVQAIAGRDRAGHLVARLYSRTGENISAAFPDLMEALTFDAALDGELLVLREGRVQSFQVLQQRLNRKVVTPALRAAYPAHIRVYDMLSLAGEDLRALGFRERRRRLEAWFIATRPGRIDLSPQLAARDWPSLAEARRDPASAGADADADAEAIEGLMLKHAESPYLPGRPKGPWFKWKRDPFIIDAVLMYAQRGHGKRSSFYSDFTFGVWREDALVPVGKAYFGFTDDELARLDAHVRRNTTARFGPVREIAHGADQGLVLEIAFEGLQESSRHKSGIAMRFPRIARIRWDKPARDADRLESLVRLLSRRA